MPSDTLPYIRAAGLVASSGENLTVYYHAHLDIIDGGTAISVPAGIGFVLRAGHVTALTALHTHRPDGVLHVESARDIPYTLGQVFTEWGVQLTRNCIGDRCTGHGEKLQTFVDGTPYSGDPAALVLRPHQEIALIHRPAKDSTPVPSRYDFPAGE